MSDRDNRIGRRKILKIGGVATAIGLAGCSGGGGDDGDSSGDDGSSSDDGGTTSSDDGGSSSGGSLEERAREEGQLSLLMSIDGPDVEDTVLPRFYEDYPWAEGQVEFVSSGTPSQRLATEYQSGSVSFDYAQVAGSEAVALLRQADDLFMPINEENAPEVVEAGQSMDYAESLLTGGQIGNRLYPAYGLPIALLYNTDIAPEGQGDPMAGPLDSYADMANDEWSINNKGITMERPSTLTSAASLFATMYPILGEEDWTETMEGIADNNPLLTNSGSRAYLNMAQGEAALTPNLINDYVSAVNEGEEGPVDIQWLEPYLISLNHGGIPNGAPNPNMAQLFLRWVTSEAGQTAIGVTGRPPASTSVASGLEIYEGIIPGDISLQPVAYNNGDYFENPNEWGDRFEELGL